MRLIAGATVLALLALPAAAADVAFDGSWKTQRFSLFSSNSYGFHGDTLTVASDGSVSMAYRPLPRSLWEASSAEWRWQVRTGVPATDLTRKGGDDRNLALYFVFLPEAEAERMQGANVRNLLGNDAARVLMYVWGGEHARGSVLPSPYLGQRGRTVVLRPSGTGDRSERVDLAQDYARAFDGQAGALVGLAVSGDSDDTDTTIRASISGLQLR